MKKRIFNILFYILIIVILCIIIVFNKEFLTINNRSIIKNEKTYNKYKNYKYVTLDLKNANETRFALNDNNKLKSIIYIVKYNNKSLLVELNSSTIITSKVDVLLKNDNNYSNELKENIIKESEETIFFNKGYYTNINLKQNKEIIKIKYIFLCIIVAMSLLSIMINFILIFKKK